MGDIIAPHGVTLVEQPLVHPVSKVFVGVWRTLAAWHALACALRRCSLIMSERPAVVAVWCINSTPPKSR
jgi:hypothetical protein